MTVWTTSERRARELALAAERHIAPNHVSHDLRVIKRASAAGPTHGIGDRRELLRKLEARLLFIDVLDTEGATAFNGLQNGRS